MTLIESLSLITASFLLLFFSESIFVFNLVIIGGALVTARIFFRITKNPHWLRFGNIACFSILFGYIISTVVYAFMNITKNGDISYRQNDFGFCYSQSIISYSMLATFMVSILLSALAHFEKPLRISEYLERSLSKQSIFIIVLSAAILVFGFINETIGYMGIYLISDRRISPLGALCSVAIPPLTSIALASLLLLPNELRKYRIVLLATSAILVLLVVLVGRRVLMYTIISSIILVGPSLLEKFRSRRINISRIICIGLVAPVLLVFGFNTFHAVRLTVNMMTYQQKPGVLEIVPYMIDLVQAPYAVVELNETLIENITQRPFVLSYLAGLMDAHMKKSTPVFGELEYALAMAVPSLFQPQKTLQMAPSIEDVIHPLLGLPVFDGPNTILTAGLNDLGFMGTLIYPVMIVGLYIFISRIIPSNWPPFLSLFILLRLMFALLYLEDSLGALVGSGLRDLAIVALVYWAVLKILGHRLSNESLSRSHV